MNRLFLFICLLLSMATLCYAAEVPQLVSFQGVLRDANQQPRDGTFDMVFRFYDADGGPSCDGGTLLLTDGHLAAGTAGPVTVSDGLFNVELGGGDLTAGSVDTLSGVFRDHEKVFVEIGVETETLCPRTRVLSSAYAISAARESDGSLDLYVDTNHQDASDDNDGLSPAMPKKTIQAAIDAVPAVLGGTATIRIADGTYNESLLIDRRLMRNQIARIVLEGNQASPSSVTLDGGEELPTGILSLGYTIIRGMEITGFTEEGISVVTAGVLIDHCRITAAAEENGIGVYRAEVELSNTVITNTVAAAIEAGWGEIVIGANTTISGTAGIILISSSNAYVKTDNPGSIVIHGDVGPAVDLDGNSDINFEGWSPLTISATSGNAMKANYHSSIVGYGNGTVGTCSASNNSFCHPFRLP